MSNIPAGASVLACFGFLFFPGIAKGYIIMQIYFLVSNEMQQFQFGVWKKYEANKSMILQINCII